MRISDWSSDVCSSDLYPLSTFDISIDRPRRGSPGRRCRSGAQFVSAIFQNWFAISYRVPAGQPAWVDGKDTLADLDRSSNDFGFLRPLFDPCRTRSRSDLMFERMLRGGSGSILFKR